MEKDRSLVTDIEGLIREQRRASLRARTIAVTLQSALTEFDRNRTIERDPMRRLELRRQWCEHAAEMIQDVRAEALRIRSIGSQLASEIGTAPPAGALDELQELAVASETTDVALAVGERIALEGLAAAG